MAELANIPTDELAEMVDMLVWAGPTSDRKRVAAWHAELLARADRDAPPVQLATDVCLEYLAELGSPFQRRIGQRVARGLNSGSYLPPLPQDN